MKVLLTERTVEIVLDEDDIRHLVDGNDVAGIPSTKFLSLFGERTVIVRRMREGKRGAGRGKAYERLWQSSS